MTTTAEHQIGSRNADSKRRFAAEVNELLRLAGPVVLAQLSWMGMGVADTIMAGRVSAMELAGVALGGNVYWPAQFFVSGSLLALTPTVAQLNGAGRQHEAGEAARQALWLALLGGILLVIYLRNATPVYHWLGITPEAIPIAERYLNALAFAAVPMLGYFVLRYLCDGMAWTRPAMVLGIGGLLLKLPLNAVFIHGEPRLGIPALGGPGCGWSTAIVVTTQFCVMLGIIARSRIRETGFLARFSWPDPAAIGRLALLGLPIGVTTSLEIALFSVTTLLVGTLSVAAVASHQVAMNIGGLAFMIPLALGMAAAIRVGQQVGSRDLAGARRSGFAAMLLALSFSLIAISIMLLGGTTLTGLYSREPEVVETAAFLLLFVAGFQIFDATQVACMGSLRGYKDTRTPMLIALIAYWAVGFPAARLLGLGGFGLEPLGLGGFWGGLIIGLLVAASFLFLRFLRLSKQADKILGFAER